MAGNLLWLILTSHNRWTYKVKVCYKKLGNQSSVDT